MPEASTFPSAAAFAFRRECLVSGPFPLCGHAALARSPVVQLFDKLSYLCAHRLQATPSVAANGVIALLDDIAAPSGAFSAHGGFRPLDGFDFVAVLIFGNHFKNMGTKSLISKCYDKRTAYSAVSLWCGPASGRRRNRRRHHGPLLGEANARRCLEQGRRDLTGTHRAACGPVYVLRQAQT
jgi:hypothetical protein